MGNIGLAFSSSTVLSHAFLLPSGACWVLALALSTPHWVVGRALSLYQTATFGGLRLSVPEFNSLNLDPLDQFCEPELRIDIKARSGPIRIMVDYVIAQEDVPAFLATMIERRRIRIRDGAKQWVLLRDLENPEIWTESYHVPTWSNMSATISEGLRRMP